MIAIVAAVLSVFAGYVMNQLPAVREFPGSGGLLWRLTAWLTLLGLCIEISTTDDAAALLVTLAKFGAVGFAVALVFDGAYLVKILRRTAASEEGASQAQDLSTRFLKKIHEQQIKPRIEDSIYQQQLIAPEMLPQDEAIVRDPVTPASVAPTGNKPGWRFPSRLRFWRRNQAEEEVPLQTRVMDLFEHRARGRLLILGEPGSGKTTTLLTLADELLTQALQSGGMRVPLLFELSTWKQDTQSLQDWLVEQLQVGYKIDPKVAKTWLKREQLVPLLDGLDELGLKRQVACTHKINQFVQELKYPYVVVCCRSEEFDQGGVKLDLDGAVKLQPLTNDQINQYFEDIGRPEVAQAIWRREGLRALTVPRKNPNRPELPRPGLLRTPLFLTMLAIAYRPETAIDSREDLFEAYIGRRLSDEVRRADRKYMAREWAYAAGREPGEEATRRYLGWLARTLDGENRVELLIEQMQPRWLDTVWQKWVYRLLSGLIGSLIVGLIFGLTFGLMISLISSLSLSLIVGLIIGLIFGLIFSLIFSLMCSLTRNPDASISPIEKFNFSISTAIQRNTLKVLFKWLLFSLTVGVIAGPMLGLSVDLASTLIIDIIQNNISIEISSLNLAFGLRTGLIAGPLLGTIIGIMVGTIEAFKSDFQIRERPNQGIFAARKNILVMMFMSYPSAILVAATSVSKGFQDFSPTIYVDSFLFGIGFATFFGFFLGGGMQAIEHFMLRVIFYRTNSVPWNYARFLNYCVERRLLQRIGGRYRFIHKELLEHCAKPTPDENPAN